MGLVGEALFGKVLDDDINVQITKKKKEKKIFEDIFQFVWLLSLLTPPPPHLPGFSGLWQMRPQGGSFSQALV